MSDSASSLLFTFGFGLVCAGAVVIILAILLAMLKQSKHSKIETAGVVIIGPIPIIFGNDKKALKTLLILSIALMGLLVASSIIYYLFLQR